MEAKESQIVVVDDDGVEYAMEILLTYENEERGHQYVLCFEEQTPDDIIAFRYDEDGQSLTEVTDDDELDEVEEVLNAFQDQQPQNN